jgi:hypothetical protein
MDMIEKYENIINWSALSRNINLTSDTLMKYIGKSWDWMAVQRNKNIIKEVIQRELKKNSCVWELYVMGPQLIHWSDISHHKLITWEIIQAFPLNPWDWKSVSRNPNITWQIICANPNIPWSYSGIYFNKNITEDIINTNFNKFANHPKSYISKNISLKSYIEHNRKEHLLVDISFNPNTTWEIIRDHINLEWRFDYISCNKFTKSSRKQYKD